MNKTISLVLVLTLCMATEVANADFTFGTPTNLGPSVNSSDTEGSPCISTDSLSLYFSSRRGGGYGLSDIWVTTREMGRPWGPPENLGPIVNSSDRDGGPGISADTLSLYFRSLRPGGYGLNDIWVTNTGLSITSGTLAFGPMTVRLLTGWLLFNGNRANWAPLIKISFQEKVGTLVRMGSMTG